jgi:hypothetical protein
MGAEAGHIHHLRPKAYDSVKDAVESGFFQVLALQRCVRSKQPFIHLYMRCKVAVQGLFLKAKFEPLSGQATNRANEGPICISVLEHPPLSSKYIQRP